MDILNTTGKRVRLLRGDLDLTQEELTRQMEKLGVKIGRSYISLLERSDSLPSGEVLAAMARVLHTTTDYLLLLTDDPLIPGEPEEDEDDLDLSDDERALIVGLRALPPADYMSLVEMIGGMINVAQRQRGRTGRALVETPAVRAAPIPRVPQSRDDLVALLGVLPESVLEELAGEAAAIIRRSARTA